MWIEIRDTGKRVESKVCHRNQIWAEAHLEYLCQDKDLWELTYFVNRYRNDDRFQRYVNRYYPGWVKMVPGLGKRLLFRVLQYLVEYKPIRPKTLFRVLPAALMWTDPEKNDQLKIEAYYNKLGFQRLGETLYWQTNWSALEVNLIQHPS